KRDHQQCQGEGDAGGHGRRGVRRTGGRPQRSGDHDPGNDERRAQRPSPLDHDPAGPGNERSRRRRTYLAGPGAARAGATSGRSGGSLDAAVSSGSVAATPRVAVSSASGSNPPGAKRSQTTTAATSSPRTTGSSIRDAVSMLDRRWARYEA